MATKTLSPHEHHRYCAEPYYIYAPPFSEGSSGIRVLHYLCHTLNQYGYESYVTTPFINPELWTPTLTQDVIEKHIKTLKKPIVIYPEVVVGTPLSLGLPVRFLLNIPGKIAGHQIFGPNDLIISYRKAFSPTEHTPLLTIPSSDPQLFHPPTETTVRRGRYFYFNRYLERGGVLHPQTNDAIEISPRKPVAFKQLADIFRNAELLYLYEESAIGLEARMCGCPIVYIPNPTLLPEFPQDDFNGRGAAWGESPEQIAFAKQTVSEIFPAVLKQYEIFHSQLDTFIDITQSAASQMKFAECYAPLLRQPSTKHQISVEWLRFHDVLEADGQVWAERMWRHWAYQPQFHLFMVITDTNDSDLEKTFEHIKNQIYSRWQLTVISDLPAPEGWGLAPPTQWLSLKRIEDAHYVLNEMTRVSDAEWICELRPGKLLKPYALLIAADEINMHPAWKVIDADSYSVQPSSSRDSLNLQARFDLFSVRENNSLGPLVLFSQKALKNVNFFGDIPLARTYDTVLRVHDFFGSSSVGRIPHVLCESRVEEPLSQVLEGEVAALHNHLQRLGLPVGLASQPYELPRQFAHCTAEVELLRSTTTVIPVSSLPDIAHPHVAQWMERFDVDVVLVDIHNQPLEWSRSGKERSGLYWLRSDPQSWTSVAAEHSQSEWLFITTPYIYPPKTPEFNQLLTVAIASNAALISPGVLLEESNVVLNEPGDPTGSGLSITKTPQQNPRCTQQVLGIRHLPLLVRRAVFQELGGLNLTDHTLSDALADLTIRATRVGYTAIWTPTVLLKQMSSILVTASPEPPSHTQSRRRLITRHLDLLTHPDWNHPDLALQQPGAIRGPKPLTWKPQLMDRPHVLCFSRPNDQVLTRWLNHLSAQALAIVMHFEAKGELPDGLAVARAKPHVLMVPFPPEPNVQAMLEDVRAITPAIPTAFYVSADDPSWSKFGSHESHRAYVEALAASMMRPHDHLFTLTTLDGDKTPAAGSWLPGVVELQPTAPLPDDWWTKGLFPTE